jgi:hypothetical protein
VRRLLRLVPFVHCADVPLQAVLEHKPLVADGTGKVSYLIVLASYVLVLVSGAMRAPRGAGKYCQWGALALSRFARAEGGRCASYQVPVANEFASGAEDAGTPDGQTRFVLVMCAWRRQTTSLPALSKPRVAQMAWEVALAEVDDSVMLRKVAFRFEASPALAAYVPPVAGGGRWTRRAAVRRRRWRSAVALRSCVSASTRSR